jgi:hypothetical protein
MADPSDRWPRIVQVLACLLLLLAFMLGERAEGLLCVLFFVLPGALVATGAHGGLLAGGTPTANLDNRPRIR